MAKDKTQKSEVACYKYILDEIRKKEWKKKNVYTQQECLSIREVKKQLRLDRPENLIEIKSNTYYVIEGKNTKTKLDEAIRQAKNQYAKKINNSKKIRANFITGVAGNDDEGFTSQSYYLKGTRWRRIKENGVEITSILSPKHIETILKNDDPEINDVEITEKEFTETAVDINNILHENSINKDYRARFISALLLSMLDGGSLNYDESTPVLINNINTKVELILRRHNKSEFSRFIKIDEPSSEDNHIKVKTAIKETHQKLLDLNIRSAMNSGNDILGSFYEVFLKYGNGAKEIGIVLTPRHITKFASSTLNITAQDLVLDLACGTGGFLVAAYDEVKKKTNNKKSFEAFKDHGIYGIEDQDPIISLALVNMIFRGDGKTNMIEGNCFDKWLNAAPNKIGVYAEYLKEDKEDRIRPITRVMMNPPFSQDRAEYEFINHALNQMQDNGLLFCVLPVGIMVKQSKWLSWRKELLRHNSVLCVVTFPPDLFYPVGTHTLGLYLKKGVPHPKDNKVLWVKVDKDGFIKVKGKRLTSNKAENQLDHISGMVKDFIEDQSIGITNKKGFIKCTSIDFRDNNLELLPHVYLDEKIPSESIIKARIENTLNDFISSMIKYKKLNDFKDNIITKTPGFFKTRRYNKKVKWKEFFINKLFINPIKTGFYHKSGDLDEGDIPLVSCVSVDCGFEGFFKIYEKQNVTKNCITIASDGQPLTSFFHYYDFTTKDNVLICKPNKDYNLTTLLFFTAQINALKWRFSYGRKCYENKVDKIKIYLPVAENGEIAEGYIDFLFKSTQQWNILYKLFN